MPTLVQAVKKHMQTGSVFIGLALLAAYLIIGPNYFPYLGIAVSFALLSTVVYLGKSQRSHFTTVLYIFTLIFCVCLVYRANEYLTFLNLLAIIILGSIMSVMPPRSDGAVEPGFIDLVVAPLKTFLGTIQSSYTYHLQMPRPEKMKVRFRIENASEVIKSAVLAILLLVVIIPLLASANPLFARWMESWFKWLDVFTWLGEILNISSWWIWTWRLAFAALLTFLIPRLVTFAQSSKNVRGGMAPLLSNLLLPKIAVAVVLGVFFLSQAQLYFASEAVLLELGYSHSEFAREVFGQLTVVALIVLGILYNDRSRRGINQVLTFILLLEASFLTVIAFKSVYDYTSFWGLTYKRLWGFTGIVWMIGALSSYLFVYLQHLKDTVFVKSILILSCFVLLGVNIANYDYLIYHYGQSVTHEGLDYYYLSTLSADSLSYQTQYEVFMNLDQAEENPPFHEVKAGYGARQASRKITDLQHKYREFDFRTFNLSEFKQYWAVRNINLEAYNQKWQMTPSAITRPKPTSTPSAVSERDKVDVFPYNGQVKPGFMIMTYYLVLGPETVKTTLTRDQVLQGHVVMDDVWDQANLNFEATILPFNISPVVADEIIQGSDDLLSYLSTKTEGVPVIIVKTLGENQKSRITFNPETGEGLIIITEEAFKDGKTLSYAVGKALGLSNSSQGLMNPQIEGLYLTPAEIEAAKLKADIVEGRLNLRG